MGIDACIDVVWKRPISDSSIELLSWCMKRDLGENMGLKRRCYYNGHYYVLADDALTVTPDDLNRMHRPGKHIGAWDFHRRIILWLLSLPSAAKIIYYGDSGGVEPVEMTTKKIKEYDKSYKEMMAAL